MKIYEDQKFTCLEQKVNDKTVPPQTSLGSKYVYNFNKQRGSNRGFKIFCFSIFFSWPANKGLRALFNSKFVTELSFQVE